MESLQIDKPTWDQVFHALGWQSFSLGLWAALGGDHQGCQVTWPNLYRAVIGMGWTAQHAELLWTQLSIRHAPVPPAPQPGMPVDPGLPPAAPGMPAPVDITADQGVTPTAVDPSLAGLAQQNVGEPAPWDRAPVAQPKPGKRKKEKTPKAPKAAKQRSTPDIDFQFIGKRFAAILIDAAIVCGIGYAISYGLQISMGEMLGKAAVSSTVRTNLIMAGVAWSLLAGMYFSMLMRREDRMGQGLGGQIMGIQVERQDGGEIDLKTVLVRQAAGSILLPWLSFWLLNQVAGWPVGVVALLIWVALSLRGRGIPDLLAGTEVSEA